MEITELEFLEKGKDWLFTHGPDFIINLVFFIIILFVGWIVIRATMRVTDIVLAKSGRVTETLQKFLLKVLNKVMWVLLLMVALPRIGIDIAPLVAGLGVTGFIVGFAFKDSLGNLAAGLMVILNRPFVVGDFIEAAGHTGSVMEINMMATILTTPDNKMVVIPNNSIWGGSIVNYSHFDTRRVDLGVGISYAADINQAREVIAKVLDGNSLILKDPAPQIDLVEMADSSLNLVVRPWCKSDDYWTVFFKANQDMKEALDKAGIEIPFPQMDVHHIGNAE